MKITFSNTPEQNELVRAMGSRNEFESKAAQEAFAQLLATQLGYIYQQADTTKFLYEDFEYKQGDDPSFPLELFANVAAGYFSIWTNPMPGGVPTNNVVQSIQEVKFATYRLDSAWSLLAKYARTMRLDIIAKALERLLQEVLLKTNINAWSVALLALAQAQHTLGHAAGATPTGHVFRSATAGAFTLDEFNKLLTFFRRVNGSWNGGTPVGGGGRPTDMIMSPEMMQYIRAMSYNPINTTAANKVAITANSQQSAAAVVTLPEAQRAQVFGSGGVPQFYGINIMELNELGFNQDYPVLFGSYANAAGSQYASNIPLQGIGAANGATFNPATDELVVVVDATKQLGMRAIGTDADTGSIFSLEPDDQFTKRSGRIGWNGGIEEGRMFVESRSLAALVV